jgi:hypothetical protein
MFSWTGKTVQELVEFSPRYVSKTLFYPHPKKKKNHTKKVTEKWI